MVCDVFVYCVYYVVGVVDVVFVEVLVLVCVCELGVVVVLQFCLVLLGVDGGMIVYWVGIVQFVQYFGWIDYFVVVEGYDQWGVIGQVLQEVYVVVDCIGCVWIFGYVCILCSLCFVFVWQ